MLSLAAIGIVALVFVMGIFRGEVKTVRMAPCPVLTVHPQGHQFVLP